MGGWMGSQICVVRSSTHPDSTSFLSFLPFHPRTHPPTHPPHPYNKALCEFSTVEGFWTYFHFLPKPSDVFTEVVPGSTPPQLLKRKLDGKNLEAFGLFKKGVKPEWEDPLNMQGTSADHSNRLLFTHPPTHPSTHPPTPGGHWECRREPTFDLPTLDKLWTHTVLALIGETLEDGSTITVRAFPPTHPPTPPTHPSTQSQRSAAHSNRLVLLHLLNHPPTHPPISPGRPCGGQEQEQTA